MLFQDETGNFAVKPRTGYSWMSGIHRKVVPKVKEKKQRVGVLGALNALDGHVCWQCSTSRTALTTIDFIKKVAAHYSTKRYLLFIWDNAPGHTAGATKKWVKRWNQDAHQRGRPKIIVIYLPVRAPWLNNIEPVWWGMIRSVIAGETYSSPTEMEDCIDAYFVGRNDRLAASRI